VGRSGLVGGEPECLEQEGDGWGKGGLQPGAPLLAVGTSVGGGPKGTGLPWVTPTPPVQQASGLHGDDVQYGPGVSG
jgi:hypothetical protein